MRIALQAQVLHHAEDLLETHALRAYDAVQLASALESSARLVAAGLAPAAARQGRDDQRGGVGRNVLFFEDG